MTNDFFICRKCERHKSPMLPMCLHKVIRETDRTSRSCYSVPRTWSGSRSSSWSGSCGLFAETRLQCFESTCPGVCGTLWLYAIRLMSISNAHTHMHSRAPLSIRKGKQAFTFFHGLTSFAQDCWPAVGKCLGCRITCANRADLLRAIKEMVYTKGQPSCYMPGMTSVLLSCTSPCFTSLYYMLSRLT